MSYCTKDTARCEKNCLLPICCYHALKDTLYYTIDLLDKYGITYWLDFGTLLGAVRHGDIIPWDNDCDISIFASSAEILAALEGKVEADGYWLDFYNPGMYRICYSKTNHNPVDIYFNHVVPASEHQLYWERNPPAGKTEHFHLKEGYAPLLEKHITEDTPITKQTIWGSQLDHTTDMPYWFVEKLVKRRFGERHFYCPRRPKKFLEFRYGPMWYYPYHWQGSSYWGGNATPLTEPLSWVKSLK